MTKANAHRKEYRAVSWRRGEDRHARNAGVQREREIANKALRKAGLPVPWQLARTARASVRESAGLRAIWQRKQKEEQLPAS